MNMISKGTGIFSKILLRSSKGQRSVIFVHNYYIALGGTICAAAAWSTNKTFLRLRRIYLDLRCSCPWNAEFELRFEDAISWWFWSTCPLRWPRGACRPGLNNVSHLTNQRVSDIGSYLNSRLRTPRVSTLSAWPPRDDLTSRSWLIKSRVEGG